MGVFEGAMRGRRPDGWWYPWLFVGGMGVVVLANAAMVAIALGTWTGLETEGHYQKGLEYNRNLAAAEAQAALGWTLTLDAAPTARSGESHVVDLHLVLADRDGRPLNNLDVSVMLIRPTHEGFDQEVRLLPAGDGAYAATVKLPLPGQWEARVLAARGDIQFQEVRRLQLP